MILQFWSPRVLNGLLGQCELVHQLFTDILILPETGNVLQYVFASLQMEKHNYFVHPFFPMAEEEEESYAGLIHC